MQVYSVLDYQGLIYSSEKKSGEALSCLAMGIYNGDVYVLDTPLLDICMPLLLMVRQQIKHRCLFSDAMNCTLNSISYID